jgi:hypothetical protein
MWDDSAAETLTIYITSCIVTHMARQKRDPTNPLVMKNFMAPAKLLAQLQHLSEKEGVSESEIIRTALEEYLKDG